MESMLPGAIVAVAGYVVISRHFQSDICVLHSLCCSGILGTLFYSFISSESRSIEHVSLYVYQVWILGFLTIWWCVM